jgi:hypothetical protein
MSQEKALPVKQYELTCKYEHPARMYKTAIEKEFIRVPCRCGVMMTAKEVK